VLAVALVFAVFALAIAYFGAAQQGQVGFHGYRTTIASLASLVIYLVPLIALILGYDTIVGERERGALELLLTMPISRLEVLLGKYLGLRCCADQCHCDRLRRWPAAAVFRN
jgi:Cu-processing system permease protein